MTTLASGLSTVNRACLASMQGKNSLTNNIWLYSRGMNKKPIPGYEGIYEVSDDGRIWSLWREGARGPRANNRLPTELKQYTDKSGYKSVALCRDGKPTRVSVHSIVALAFIGERGSLVVDHIDDNPSNNALTNLRLISHSLNLARGKGINSKHGFRGISKRVNPSGSISWRSYATINGKHHHLGTFSTPAEASRFREEYVEARTK